MNNIEIGDIVEIIEYGHIGWANDGSEVQSMDAMPHLVGKQGVVKAKDKFNKYTLDGIIGKSYPFNKDQLRKVLPLDNKVVGLTNFLDDVIKKAKDGRQN